MDLLIYCAILAILGFVRIGQTSRISEDEGIAETGATVLVQEYDNIPIGDNLALNREYNAFTLILEELGLM